jgi:hypothetical protein
MRLPNVVAETACRAYPDEPRVGVGVVVFRKPIAAGQAPEVGYHTPPTGFTWILSHTSILVI